MEMAVTIRNLVKNYNGVNVVDHLDLNVPVGSIYGLSALAGHFSMLHCH